MKKQYIKPSSMVEATPSPEVMFTISIGTGPDGGFGEGSGNTGSDITINGKQFHFDFDDEWEDYQYE